MRRKLWIKAPAKEGALGQMSKIFIYFMHTCIHFFKKPNKKIYNRAKELYCDATIFVFLFFVVYLPKKYGNWKMAQGCRLSPINDIALKLINLKWYRGNIRALFPVQVR